MHGAISKPFRPQRSSSLSYRRRRQISSFLVPIVTILVFIFLAREFYIHSGLSHLPPPEQEFGVLGYTVKQKPAEPRIGKVTALYGPPNELYEAALRTHEEHNRRWGYVHKVLRREITDGYWNKYGYLLSIVLQELEKPEDERLEWLLWDDASTVLLNPNIPLSVFLPPDNLPTRPSSDFDDRNDDPTNIFLLASKWPNSPGKYNPPSRNPYAVTDPDPPNVSSFFIRVHSWSVRFLTQVMTAPIYLDEVYDAINFDAAAFSELTRDEAFRGNTAFVPRSWFGAHAYKVEDPENPESSNFEYDGETGGLNVHFSGLAGDRWAILAQWLDYVSPDKRQIPGIPRRSSREQTVNIHNVPLAETGLVEETATFWQRVAQAKTVQYRADRVVYTSGSNVIGGDFLTAWYALKDAVELRPYDFQGMDISVQAMLQQLAVGDG